MKVDDAASPENESSSEIPCTCSEAVQSRPERPCPIYQNIRFTTTKGSRSRLDRIVFRNYYVESISIDQRHSDRWVNILKDQRLMKHAHYEDDAQAWHALETSIFENTFNPTLCCNADENEIGMLRISLKQPSMMWPKFELRQVRCYSKR